MNTSSRTRCKRGGILSAYGEEFNLLVVFLKGAPLVLLSFFKGEFSFGSPPY